MRPHSPFAAPPLISPSGAPQRQLSFTGTDSTLDCPRVKLGLVVSVLLVDCETVPTETHNATLSPASRALERDRSVRGYPTHVPDPLSSFGHAAWRFLKVAPAGRYAALDLSDRIGADSCPCAFHSAFSAPSRAASAKRKLFAGSLARPAKGASKSRTSGQLFSAASRVCDCHANAAV